MITLIKVLRNLSWWTPLSSRINWC